MEEFGGVIRVSFETGRVWVRVGGGGGGRCGDVPVFNVGGGVVEGSRRFLRIVKTWSHYGQECTVSCI